MCFWELYCRYCTFGTLSYVDISKECNLRKVGISQILSIFQNGLFYFVSAFYTFALYFINVNQSMIFVSIIITIIIIIIITIIIINILLKGDYVLWQFDKSVVFQPWKGQKINKTEFVTKVVEIIVLFVCIWKYFSNYW